MTPEDLTPADRIAAQEALVRIYNARHSRLKFETDCQAQAKRERQGIGLIKVHAREQVRKRRLRTR